MTDRPTRLRELAAVFGTLGVIGFGGPAAHIALMRREVVERRWLTDQQMVDLVGITNLSRQRRGAVVGTRPVGRAGGGRRRGRAGGSGDRHRPLTSR